jgi:hypothetical protein
MRYVLAREVINQEMARVTAERIREEERESPSPAILVYLDSHMSSLVLLEQLLANKEDMAAIDAILNGSLF